MPDPLMAETRYPDEGNTVTPEEEVPELPTLVAPPFCAPIPAPEPDDAPHLIGLPRAGQRLDDFDLLAVLGAGSFARVYLARQVSLGRAVALKVSRNHGQEGRTLASLEHDHIVRVFSEVVDHGRDLRLCACNTCRARRSKR